MKQRLNKIVSLGLIIMLVGTVLFFEQVRPVLLDISTAEDAHAAGNYFLKSLGESGTETFTYATAMDVTSDGGMVVTSQTSSFGVPGGSLMVSKLTNEGIVEWTKTIDDINGGGVAQVSDGGYMVLGETNDYGVTLSGWAVVKLNSSGVEQWTNTYDDTANENPYSIAATSDGGAILAGRSSVEGNEPIALKIDSSGNIEWNRDYGTSSYDHATHVFETSDSGYLLVGSTLGFGISGSGALLIEKLNSSGVEQWTKTIDGSGAEGGVSGVETSDGGFAIVGYTDSWGEGGNDIMVSKFNSSGVEQWTKTMGGSGAEQGFGISETSNSDLLVVGYTNSIGTGSSSGVLIRLSSTGTEVWTKTISGTGSESMRVVDENTDGSISVLGLTSSYGAGFNDLWVGRLDSSGDVGTCSPIVDDTASLTFSSQSVSEVDRSIIDTTYTMGKSVETVTETDQTAAASNQCYVLGPSENDATVTADVEASTSFSFGSNTISLGSLSTGDVTASSTSLDVTSNASNGYSLYLDDVNDSGFSSGSDTIPMTTGTLSAGTAGAGWSLDVSGASLAYNGGTCPGNNAVTDIGTSSFQAVTVTEPTSQTYNFCFAASVGSTTPAGSYSHVAQLTFVANY